MDPLKASLDSKESYLLLPTSHTQPRPQTQTRSQTRRFVPLFLVSLSLVSLYCQFGPISPQHAFTRAADHPDHRSLMGYLKQFGSIDSKRGNKFLSRVQALNEKEEQQDIYTRFLSVPSPESAKRVSKSFTRETHIAGTEGDRLSALRVKAQWEELLGIPQSGEGGKVFDAGTKEDRESLMGSSSTRHVRCRRGRGGRWRRIVKKLKRFFLSSTSPSSHHHHHSKHPRHPNPSLSTPRVWISTYYPMLNYPISSSITLTPSNASSSVPSFTAKLQEDVFEEEDPTSGKGVKVFHGFSMNGTGEGRLVYAGRGRKEDYERLREEGIDVEGNVVIVQYGGSFRGLKVKAAAEAGAVACIIYSDPAADGEITIENGHKPYPFGPARAPSSVQRGSVQYLSIRPGDPLTPSLPAYNPSLPNSPSRLPRSSPDLNIPTIPSLPISYEDAIPLLKSLNGRGKRREDVEGGWKEGGLRYRGVEYWTGPGEEVVKLRNGMEEKVTKIWNTMAIIPGQIEDEIVVIGNHNDAWTFGAGDPNSGTSSMHETVRGFSELMKTGWKPFRTILLASWDAEEYGLIGSTEFGEDFTDYLRERVVAYLNLDVSVSGSSFELAASPSLADLLKNCSGMVIDPTAPQGKQDLGETKVKTLGSGSDFSVFLQYIGVAAGNLGFSGAPNDPVYHYHSNFDSFAWMEKFGDPTFERHVVVSKILGLTALRLIEDLVLPLNTTAYALELEHYLLKVPSLPSYPGREQLDLTSLGAKLSTLVSTSRSLDSHASSLLHELSHLHSEPFKSKHKQRKELEKVLKGIREVNLKKKGFESTLLVQKGEDGLQGREWYKSLVVAPGRWLGYGATTLPGLTEALELDGDVPQAVREAQRLEKSIDRAINLLEVKK